MILVAVFAIWLLVSLIHTGVVLAIGALVGADVAVVGVFLGPEVASTSVSGRQIRLNLLPLGAYVRFRRHVAPAHQGVMLLAANCVVLLIAAAFVGFEYEARVFFRVWTWAMTGGVFSTEEGAAALFQTLSTSLTAATSASRTGMIAAACVAINLLPIPMLNGGDAILAFCQAFFNLSDSTREKIQLAGACVVLIGLVTWLYWLARYMRLLS